MFSDNLNKRRWFWALICTLVNASICFVLLSPSVGFDDANITLNYAENIAAGHGYVYNIGGERVEGSTSPLWTAINTLAYFLPVAPEVSLAILGFFIAWMTVWIAMCSGERLFELAGVRAGLATGLVGVGFLALPSFFGWVVWSLMDFGFWVLLVMCCYWLSASFVLHKGTPAKHALLGTVAALMAITRPEGIAVIFGFFLLLVLFSLFAPSDKRRLAPAFVILVAGASSYALMGLFRVIYFGDLLPNTYYSKVSVDYLSQLVQGLRYLRDFMSSALNGGILVLALALPLLVSRSGNWKSLQPLWGVTILATFGMMILYTLIGGDHFGSFRFFLFVYPALLPLAALSLYMIWRKLPVAFQHPRAPALIALMLVLGTWAVFSQNKGGYAHELRIAEQGRHIGRVLNGYPEKPSVGIIAAGGIAMTYEGHIYDLMGLNWVDMARADRHQIGAYVNHGGFSKTVFYDTLPDIVHPQIGACDKETYDSNRFFGAVLRGVMREPRFQSLYKFECFEDLRFYRLDDAVRRLSDTEVAADASDLVNRE